MLNTKTTTNNTNPTTPNFPIKTNIFTGENNDVYSLIYHYLCQIGYDYDLNKKEMDLALNFFNNHAYQDPNGNPFFFRPSEYQYED